jgi:hypothetical protein
MKGWQRALDERYRDGLEWGRWAVARWSEFPVDAEPRPLVLVGEAIGAGDGFRSGEAKLAYLDGLIEAAVPLAEGVMERLTGGPGRRRDLPPLAIVRTERCESEFVTDRGRRPLPAWRLHLDGGHGPLVVLDPDLRPWDPGERTDLPPPTAARPGGGPGTHAELHADGRTLTHHFLGALPQFERYPRAEAIESAHAVAIVPEGEDIGPATARILPGYMHQVVVTLAEPLGARVLVDLRGNPAEVTAVG